ncbi:acyl-coenzyme A synthetase ACSM4, mitochondrial-like [Varroa jacobsoni]|uniref:acyl-coenzyme A synthetase ACSM4, mitochondrial-like n=1 Tax=Varroa jacobsoni TaxID=62625 RepID=UPI000BF9936D|nr:acyl-coenzyme A synthetase ACSM4, mitochondrial-like [Varroa jacobsoni]
MLSKRAIFLARVGVRYASVSEISVKDIVDRRIVGMVPKRFNFARDVIDHWAEKEQKNERPSSHPALKVIGFSSRTERNINYTELSQLSKALAGGFLYELGLTRDDRILLCLPRCADFWIVTIVALRTGIEFTSVTPQALSRDLRYRIQQFRPTVIITDKIEEVTEAEYLNWPVKHKICVNKKAANWRLLDTLYGNSLFEATDTQASDHALVYFTSGTTGFPKMVQHNQAYTLGHMSGLTNLLLDMTTTDDFLCTADTGWAKTAFGTYPIFIAGSSIVIDLVNRFDANRLVNLIQSHRITHISSAPTVYRMMLALRKSFSFPSLRGSYSGGEPLSAETFNKWKANTGIEIREAFAQSETLMVCTSNPSFPAKPGSMGKAVPEFEVAVIDDNLQPVKTNEVGHMAIKIRPHYPPGLFVGYKDNPKKTMEVFQGDYYLTGDKVRCDEDGYFWFEMRADDVINSAGYRIGPVEIESVLHEHKDVAESAIVGSPDHERVQVVKAYVVLKDEKKASEALKKELQDFVKKRTAPYKYPREIEFRKSLPKTTSGKVQRHILREEAKAGKKINIGTPLL